MSNFLPSLSIIFGVDTSTVGLDMSKVRIGGCGHSNSTCVVASDFQALLDKTHRISPVCSIVNGNLSIGFQLKVNFMLQPSWSHRMIFVSQRRTHLSPLSIYVGPEIGGIFDR